MRNPHTMKSHVIVSIVLAFFLSVQAEAVIYPFAPVSYNSGAAGAMALQLSMEVKDLGGGLVEFRFYNNLAPGDVVASPIPGVITGVFFEDGFLDSMGSFNYYSDDFPYMNWADTTGSIGGSAPWGLPFGTGHSFEAETDSGIKPGVYPDEGLGIEFALTTGGSIGDVHDAIAQGFLGNLSGDSLRIGIHVQGLPTELGGTDDAKSDAFILTPIPPSIIIGLLGMGVAGIKLRKFA